MPWPAVRQKTVTNVALNNYDNYKCEIIHCINDSNVKISNLKANNPVEQNETATSFQRVTV